LRRPVTIDVGGSQQRVLTWDVPSIMGLYTAELKDPSTAQLTKFDIHEKIKTGFLKFNIEADWGVPVHGNLGVQVVRSDQASDGFAFTQDPVNPLQPLHGGATYTDVLPSLNLVADLTDNLILRFGVGKTMARPRMDDMRAGIDQPFVEPLSQGNPIGKWSANGGGKPELKPWRAKAVDLTTEYYFNKRSYFAVAGFFKKLDSFIYDRTSAMDFSGFTNFDPTVTPGCAPTEPDCDPNIGTFTRKDNGEGGKVYGVEVAASLDGSLITPALDGFGLILSNANTRNSLPDDENGNPINLDGFSSTVNSVALYFERGGFSARVSRYHRSAFTATTRSVLLFTQQSTKIDELVGVDAQISYSFESGALDGLTLLLQGNNLTNDPTVTMQSPETVGSAGSQTGLLPSIDEDFGRVLLFGASYKF
jgi:iron complex outermembrane receptor protein